MPRTIEIVKRDTTPTALSSQFEYSVILWDSRNENKIWLRTFQTALDSEMFAKRIQRALRDPDIKIEYSYN